MSSLSETLVASIANVKGSKKIYVLKGFNYWVDSIAVKLDSAYIGAVPTIKKDASIELPELNKQLQSGTSFYITFENLIWLRNNSLAGIASMYGYDLVCIENDLFSGYFPDVNDESEVFEKNNLIESDIDNYLQDYYGDMSLRGKDGFIVYNDAPGIKLQTLLLTSIVTHKNTNLVGDAVALPEECDNITLASTILDLIENSTAKVTYVISKNGDSELQNTIQKLSLVGIVCESREYETEARSIEQKDIDAYTEILHRKNTNFNFYDLKVYSDPYENNELGNVSQLQIIDDLVKNSLLAQSNEPFRDIFVTAPTGAGKSVMFQVPSIFLSEKHQLLTLVVSPLIGLMNDQVDNIQSMTKTAATINSDYTPLEKERTLEKVKSGEVSILYLSPESLLSNADIASLIGDRKIGLLVVDEAHIVATWGKSFRPDYWYLGEFINKLRNSRYSSHRFPIATFTATATFGGDDNMYQEIIDSLHMTPVKYIGNVKRDDISFNVAYKQKEIAYREEKLACAVSAINTFQASGNKTLVYVPYTKHILELFMKLDDQEKIGRYSGNMTPADKNETLKTIKTGEKSVVLATKAFGMGIDIDDIKNVYHFAPTGNIADYVQEIGRAARRRDMKGVAYTDFYKEDFRYINQLHGLSSVKNYQVIAVLKKIYDLYTKYQKRNFLVAPEEFSFIFADQKQESDVDAKLKSTLLIIKKDFESNTYQQTFLPLVFKPRGLFTQGYFTIKDNFIDTLKERNLLRFFTNLNSSRIVTSTDRYGSEITTRLAGDTYKLDFKKLWESQFKDMSFGNFKRQFYMNELPGFSFKVGESVLPKVIIDINSGAIKIVDLRIRVLRFLDGLKSVLDFKKQEGKYFSSESLAPLLLEITNIEKKPIADMIALTIMEILKKVDTKSLYSFGFSSFNSATGKYIIRNNSYEKAIVKLKQSARSMLSDSEASKITRYYQKTTGSNEVIVAQIIELLEIAEVKISTGSSPEFFIRVNSPYAIENIIKNPRYVSRTVALVGILHKESVKFMEYFFTKLHDDEARWQFIENYFLGMLDAKEIKNSLNDKPLLSKENTNE